MLCSDKTGTLTENVMVFKEVVVIITKNHEKESIFQCSSNENTDDQACMGGGQYSEAELQYRRPLPMCSFSDLAGR